MNDTWAAVCRLVVARAESRCEYCRMHQSLQGATFHVEHVRPQSAGGSDSADNLALACPACNLSKSSHTTALDPTTSQLVPLFSPRLHRWSDHFRWQGYCIEPLTATGRATVAALGLNAPRRQLIRAAEGQFGMFPPDATG
jgi:hypothetical protein